MELMAKVSELMPSGHPDFKSVVNYPTIREMEAEHGKLNVLKILTIMVADFCNSMNVARNMNDDQQIEAAHMLLDECGNFRLEDYVMMFTMAKRGLFKLDIKDRIEMATIARILDHYWQIRDEAGKDIQEQQIAQEENYLNRKDLEIAGPLKDFFTNWAKMTKAEIKEEAAELEEKRRINREKQIEAFKELTGITDAQVEEIRREIDNRVKKSA